MTKEALKYILMFIVLVVAQAVVFNHLCLWNVAIPLVFIYFIMVLPVTVPFSGVVALSFLLGLSVDAFSNTPGMNALACTLLGALRMPVLHLYYPREEDMSQSEPSSRTLGPAAFMKYVFTLTLVYCLMFFFIEAFTFYDWVLMLARAIASTFLTFIIILAIAALSVQRR